MAKKPTDDLFEKSTMTFGEHLEELRVCLFRSVAGIGLGCLIGFFMANAVVRFFQSPLERAMADYYVEKAVAEFGSSFGRTPSVEVERQILEEGLIPEQLQIEPAQLAETLRLTYPESFAGLQISPNWFTSGDFLIDGAVRWCRDLLTSKEATNSPQGRIWQLLDEERRKQTERLARVNGHPTPEEMAQILEVYRKAFDAAMGVFNASKKFPREEMYSLTDQIRRSSRSVCGNLAEAWRKRRYKAAFISKLSDAEGEAAEV